MDGVVVLETSASLLPHMIQLKGLLMLPKPDLWARLAASILHSGKGYGGWWEFCVFEEALDDCSGEAVLGSR